MSRFYNNCVDEASLTTLCPICLDSFQGAKGVRVRRVDPKQKIKDVCPTARFAMVSIIMYSPIRTLGSM